MIVVDASAATLLFCDPTSEPRTARAREVLSDDPAWLVPEHWRVEVCAALRGLDRGGKLRDATRAVRLLGRLTVATVPTEELLARMWQLRGTLSTYDAAYVAAAERAGLTLVTADARLARSSAHRCPITVIG
ncbi:type II toxin-antitoxin system VapC family toxin [Cellulomonas composti]|uniref:Ribonuclease VapC n=1 Tax=Cellulomonas composti TaxID=266130 RepID=A0A511JA37_9CELL|nr:type II toxin-antitoxin system VapC family toxin [Cellulomonas composti]GEL94842.1 VapC ribonuclease [Cellulomonas composti]